MNQYLFYHVEFPVSLYGESLDRYLSKGWYRMQDSIYDCSHLLDFEEMMLFPIRRIRFPVNKITERKSHKRIRKLNRFFKIVYDDKVKLTHEDYALYLKYYTHINFDGYPSITQALINKKPHDVYDTRCLRIYDGGELIAIGFFDVGKISAASILHFFDPDYSKYSLGKFLMLETIDRIREMNVEYYYPGYVVAGRPKFDYKLFIGRDIVEHFNIMTNEWEPFYDELLNYPEPATLADILTYLFIQKQALSAYESDETENQ